ncbi:hypothetical protein HBI56_173270 [Parastagonospora nodorum]|nr:hypothetical protein HBI10_177230 [Parastagonospora nodorum]KAH4017633.1 hypothetical protein HBI13_142770 [Parastagonospora nodorum]KAH4185058.1 hypothetical protein HBH42_183670 [Parastagonospora nodorum]KAH4216343.1 hypothetical protein HBI06_233380 [Parastagonospora nodorum]KAH4255398.1 hypothetical protein HBI03_175880 [Parastagonospora nodorum]
MTAVELSPGKRNDLSIFMGFPNTTDYDFSRQYYQTKMDEYDAVTTQQATFPLVSGAREIFVPREPFRNLESENVLGLTPEDRLEPELGIECAHFWIVQYRKLKNKFNSGLGITTVRARAWEAYQRNRWTIQMYRFKNGATDRDARLEDICRRCQDNPTAFGEWVVEKRGDWNLGTSSHNAVITALEQGMKSYRAMEPFDNKPAEELFGLRQGQRAKAPSGDFNGQAWIVQYLPPVTQRDPDGANAHDSGIGVTTNRGFAEKVYATPGWRMQMYEFTPAQKQPRLEAIVSYCTNHPTDFGKWVSTLEGASFDGTSSFRTWTSALDDASNYGTSSFLVEAQKLAAAAADAHNKATAAPDNPGRNRRFDPIRDL